MKALLEDDDGRNQGSRTASLPAHADLPLAAADGDVDRPSPHRRRALFRHAARGLVADGGGGRSSRLWDCRDVYQFVCRAPHPVRLHLGAHPSHAGRHPPFDLGYRARIRGERTGVARACDGGRVGDAYAAAVELRLSRPGRLAMSGERLLTPLARVRGLGSARSGTEHFWRQRLTAVANVPLTIAFVFIVIGLLGRNHAAVVQILGSPLVAVIMLLFIVSITTHMRIGMQVIIE